MLNKPQLFAAATLAAFALTPNLTLASDRDDDDDRAENKCLSSDDDRSKLNVVGLTSDSRLVCFSEFKPEKAKTIGFVQGLSGGDSKLIGIDYRVQDGGLYGVGNAGGVYKIDASNATATLVNRIGVALSGASFGVDFNPAADRLRIVSDTGQNLRHNVNVGGVTLSDTTLNYTAGTAALGVVGSAYTNNDLDTSTATTLFDIDSNLDQVVIQSPPNAGTLVATGKLTLNAGAALGFDAYSTVRNNVTVANQALATFRADDSASSLYAVNLLTGKATLRGSFKASDDVTDIAIPLNQL